MAPGVDCGGFLQLSLSFWGVAGFIVFSTRRRIPLDIINFIGNGAGSRSIDAEKRLKHAG
jgi:hypothetical protein